MLASVEAALTEIKDSGSTEGALELNKILVESFQKAATDNDEKKIEEIIDALGKLSSNTFTGKVLEAETLKQNKIERENFYIKGEPAYEKLKQKGIDVAKNSPLLILIFLSSNNVKSNISPEQFNNLVGFFKYCSHDDLLAIHYYLGKIVKITPKKLQGENSLEKLFLDIESKLRGPHQQVKFNLKSTDGGIFEKLEKELQVYIPVDYEKLQQEIIGHYNQAYHTVNNDHYIDLHVEESPLLHFLKKDGNTLNKLTRSTSDLALSYTKFTTIDELKALIYHLANLSIFITGSKESQSFAKNLKKDLDERVGKNSQERQNIDKPTLAEFKVRVLKYL